MQARDADFMCRSVTLAGGLLLLIWSENDRKQRSEDMGLPSGARARPCRVPPSHATATLDSAARAPRRAPPLRRPTRPGMESASSDRLQLCGLARCRPAASSLRRLPPQPGRSRTVGASC